MAELHPSIITEQNVTKAAIIRKEQHLIMPHNKPVVRAS